MISRVMELTALATIGVASLTHLNRACCPPWWDRLAFAAAFAGTVWAAFEPTGRVLLFVSLAAVFMRHFAIERRDPRHRR